MIIENNLYVYKAKCLRVVDGDTFHAEIDLGFRTSIRAPVRLAGINTPELLSKDPEERKRAYTARTALEQFLGDGEFYLRSVELDKYGRVLGTAIRKDGLDATYWMISGGHGVPMKG